MRKRRGFSGNAAPIGVRWLLKAVPRPCEFEDILGGIDITVSNVPTERTDMGSYRQRFLHNLSTLVAFLRGETRVHSDDLMSSTLSLNFKDSEERAPRSVHDGFCQGMILYHVENTQLLNGDDLIAFGILLGRLIVKVSALAFDLEMSFRRIPGGDPLTVTPFLTSAELALLSAERLLRGAIETGVLHRVAFAIGEEGLQAHINPDVRMLTRAWLVRSQWLGLTDNQSVPMAIGTMHEVNRLRSSFDGTMQFDLEEVPQFLGNNEVFLVFMQIHIFAILTQLDTMPTVWRLPAGKAHIGKAQLFRREEAFEGLGETIRQHLYRGRWHMLTATAFELRGQIVLAWERAILLILLLQGLKHLIIQEARLTQTLHQQAGLFFIHQQAILKRSHADILCI